MDKGGQQKFHPGGIASLFDHLIRPVQHGLRNCHANLLRGLEIDPQLEFRWLLDRKIARLRPFEDLVYIGGGAPVAVRAVPAVGHEPPASTKYLLGYTDGSRLFNAKSAIRFMLERISGPTTGT